jgi:hypothetical protein
MFTSSGREEDRGRCVGGIYLRKREGVHLEKGRLGAVYIAMHLYAIEYLIV